MAKSRNSKQRPIGTIRSWLDLTRLIETLAHQSTNWIFRGEPSDTYELRPSCGRQGSREDTRTFKYDPVHERAALRRFIYDAQPYVGYSPRSDLEWLAI